MGNCCAKWCPCCFCCLPPKDDKPRTVTPNLALPGVQPDSKVHPNHKFKCNKVKTAKYTAWDFIPLNLFKQFHAWTNWFFLVTVIINFVPAISAFGNYISWIPLAAVLLSTAIKDAVEDYQRTKADKKLNDTATMVYGNGQYEKTTWERVHPGDVLRVECNEAIPADLLVLNSSDPDGVCFVETANLDGESNLKQREVLRCFQKTSDFRAESLSPYRVLIEAPNAEVYRINGSFFRVEKPAESDVNRTLELLGDEALETERSGSPKLRDEQVPINKENVLLRGCKLRNTDFIVGFVLYAGHDTKVMMNDNGSKFKRSKLERRIQKDTVYCGILLFILCAAGAIGEYIWLLNFGTNNVPYLSGFASQYDSGTQGTITFFIFVVYLKSLIPLALFVSQEVVKMLQIDIMRNDVELFDETTNRGLACRSWNLTEDLGQIQYIFSDKTGTLTDNVMRFRRCVVNGNDYVFDDPRLDSGGNHKDGKTQSIVGETVNGQEEVTFDNAGGIPPLTNCSRDLSHMSLQSLLEYSQVLQISVSADRSARSLPNFAAKVSESHVSLLHHFIFMMSVCNTVVVSSTHHQEKKKSASASEINQLFDAYEAESSDELALVKAACLLGCKLRQRTNNKVSVKLPGEASDVQFDVLRVLPFDSERKRMSIVVQHPVNKAIVLYCKGADSSILPLLSQQFEQTNSGVLTRTKHVIEEYAKVGLRTLCFAKRVLSSDEYQQWCTVYDAAERALENREEKLQDAMRLVEREFALVGAVGIEDKLQEQVPETIEALRQAGIHVWMLTGDKQETAVNIGFSCRLLNTSQKMLFLNETSALRTRRKVAFYLQGVERLKEKLIRHHKEINQKLKDEKADASEFEAVMEKLAKRDVDLALVIDGGTLKFVLEDAECSTQFLELARYCKSVLCCRTTPLQKGSVVKLVMEKLGKYSLAIGDGANDVSMIKTANVGIGIMGREGLQASMASDFAISRFKHLKKLLLVHGHWCYHRYATMALTIFQREIQWLMVFFWYQIFNGFSAIIMVDQIYQTVFDVLLVVFPPIYIGVFDQVVCQEVLMEEPALYRFSRKSLHYKSNTFWTFFADGLWQSAVIFFLSFAIYTDTEFGMWEFGIQVYFASVTTAILSTAMHTSSWTASGICLTILSYCLTWLVPLIYNGLTSSATGSPPENAYWVLFNHAQAVEFWTVQLAAIIVSIMPRLVYKVVTCYFEPSAIQLAQIKQAVRRQKTEQDASKQQQAKPDKVEKQQQTDAPRRTERKINWKLLKDLLASPPNNRLTNSNPENTSTSPQLVENSYLASENYKSTTSMAANEKERESVGAISQEPANPQSTTNAANVRIDLTNIGDNNTESVQPTGSSAARRSKRRNQVAPVQQDAATKV